MSIDPKRLKQLRNEKGLTRSGLAEKSKISERTIARLESEAGPPAKRRERTVNELAKVFGVEPGVLTGELPLPDAAAGAHAVKGQRRKVSAALQPNASLAYALIKRRYGLGLTTLVNAAPLMFVLLAEGSFVWRREKAKEAEEAADRLKSLGLGNRKIWQAAGRAEAAAASEEYSANRRDLFAEELVERGDWDEYYEPDLHNPFADYLRALAEKIDEPDIVEIGEDIEDRGPLKNFPHFEICNSDVEDFTGGDDRLSLALRIGWLRADSIPEDLLGEDALKERQEWLEEQIPEKVKEPLEQLMSLDLGPSEAGGGESDR